ncbi:MAG TPA: glycosyltransferase [Candidatus Acidoferrales bacterium]|nr:glycosyltransferase [Candidatus Acidoferrales bacterium]
MKTVPADVRGRIVSGMRWTVWLTALAAPFAYGTNILLARASPETIGTYGLLAVYVGLVSSVFYLGGDAVSIKFLPELGSRDQARFLGSYFLVICLSLAPWLGLAAARPAGLRYLFGQQANVRFLLLALGLAPIPIFFFLVNAALKARLDFQHAQMLARLVTVGSFLFYAIVYFGGRGWLNRHPAPILWSAYLTLTALAAGLGAWRLGRSGIRESGGPAAARFFLPRGFWSYTLGTQQVSLLRFLQRFDYVLVLDFGGLRALGEYVAVTSLALGIALVNGYFFDTLLPSLTNLLAAGNRAGAAEAFRMHMRIVFLVTAATSSGLMLLAAPLTGMFGRNYTGLAPAVVVLSLLAGTASPGAAGGTLLSSIGKPQRAVWASLVQLGLYAGLFFLLWPSYHLIGAVAALGLSMLVANGLLFIAGTRSVPFSARLGGDYARFGAVMIPAGVIAWQGTLRHPLLAMPAWALLIFGYLVAGRYRLAECRALWRCFFPARLDSRTPASRPQRPQEADGGGAANSAGEAGGDPREAALRQGTSRVSVIIPTKSRPVELGATVESLFRQTALPAELIIVDQNPDGRSRNGVERALQSLPESSRQRMRLAYIQDTSIAGAAAARNRGMEAAREPILLFLDDDVTLEERFIEELLRVYEQEPALAGASGIITNYLPPALLLRAWSALFARGPFRDDRQPLYWHAERLRHSPPLPVTRFTGACMSFRAEAIAGLRFDERIPQSYGEDVDFCLRARRAGALVIAPRARVAHHRSAAGRLAEDRLKREARAAAYLYRKHWRHGTRNRFCFAWLNAGFGIQAALASLRRRSTAPWQALVEGCRQCRWKAAP